MFLYSFFLAGVPAAWLILAGIVVAITLIWYLFAAQISVSLMGAGPMTEIPELVLFAQAAEEYAKQAGFTKAPRLYVMNSPTVNALAVGHPRNGAVVFTAGAFEHLQDNELIAVLGHEYQHIKQHDSLLLIFNMVVAFAIRLATYLLMVVAALGGIVIDMFLAVYAGIVRTGSSSGGFFVRVVRGISNWGLWLINVLLMYATRQAEFRADAAGVRLAKLEELISHVAGPTPNAEGA